MFTLHMDSWQELHPHSLPDLQGSVAHPQPLLLELDPAETGGQNTSKPNSTVHEKDYIHHDQVGFTPGMKMWFNILRAITVIHHLNRCRKIFDKIQHSFIIKILNNVGT